MPERSVLIVDDSPANLEILVGVLADTDLQVLVARDGEGALERLAHVRPDLILLDVVMPGIDGFEVCRRLKADDTTRDIPVIFMTARSDTVDKMRGFALGAVDYVTKPFEPEELLARIEAHLTIRSLQAEVEANNSRLQREVAERERAERERAEAGLQEANAALGQRVAEATEELRQALGQVEEYRDRLQAENVYLQQEIQLSHNFGEIVTQSPKLTAVLEQVEQVAATDATVLILGETGTGKELVARALHSASQRRDRSLVKVNCAALPANLIESELFGHEKGAFTGAISRRAGRFELADGGTIFLDEIGELPVELQVRLLRVLQEGEFERLGGTATIRVDVRVIAATNRDLQKAVADGTFRDDLYYRLCVFPIHCPPLRERREDVPLLTRHFVQKHGSRIGKHIDSIPLAVMDSLQTYDWPGNVRELENVIERAIVLSPVQRLELRDWLSGPGASSGETLVPTLADKEREYITQVMEMTGWRVRGKRGAAELLGLKPTTLDARVKKLGIKKGG